MCAGPPSRAKRLSPVRRGDSRKTLSACRCGVRMRSACPKQIRCHRRSHGLARRKNIFNRFVIYYVIYRVILTPSSASRAYPQFTFSVMGAHTCIMLHIVCSVMFSHAIKIKKIKNSFSRVSPPVMLVRMRCISSSGLHIYN